MRSKAVLVVKDLEDKEFMIPFHESWVQRVELEARQVWVRPVLDLREEPEGGKTKD